jgi:hypothetical protein
MLDRLGSVLADTRREAAARDTSGWARLAQGLLDRCHERQREFVLDPGRRVAALVARGGGKTHGGRARLMRRLLRTKQAKCLFVATTRGAAEELMWSPLKAICEENQLEAKFNETKLKLTLLRNGAELRLVGADDKREIEKLRGLPFHEVGIDEAASHQAALLRNLIERIIGPRLGDFGGVLWMVGTPGHILSGPFYDVTRPGAEVSRKWDERDDPAFRDWVRWSLHTWSLQDNTFVPQNWAEALVEKEANGWSDQNPIWRREFLGQWAADDTENVYKFRPYLDDGQEWNVWTPGEKTKSNPFGLPSGHEWRFVYGVDLGHHDPFALQVLAYSETSPNLYQVWEFSKKGMTVREIAETLIGPELNHDKPRGIVGLTGWPEGAVADTAGLGDMVLKELTEVYGIRLEPAEKKNKHDAIELLNSDLVDGRFKVLKGSKLMEEMQHLQWAIDDMGRLKENKAQLNNNADAAVYGRKRAQHHHSKEPAAPRPLPGTDEALDLQAKDEEEAAAREPSEFDLASEGDFFGGL